MVSSLNETQPGLPRYFDTTGQDPITTVFVLEALRRWVEPGDLSNFIARAETWLASNEMIATQWPSPGWTDEDRIEVVIVYFQRRSALLRQIDGFLLMARDFTHKAEELSRIGGANNRRLAAVACVHAVEMFIYGVFEKRTDFGVSIYRDKGDATIGPRQAVSLLQKTLQETNELEIGRSISYADRLRGLFSLRDGIIHQAQEISSDQLNSGMSAVTSFIEKYSRALIQMNILE